MSPHTFVLVLVAASAILAFWCGARFPSLGPSTLPLAALHVLAGLAAVRAIPGLTNAVLDFSGDLARFLAPFGIALPLFTYCFLTGLWLMRVIHRSVTGLPH
jgi:hypothetical protein